MRRPKMEFLPDDAYAVHLSSAAHMANTYLDWDTVGSGKTPDDPVGPEEDVNDPHQRQSMFIERKFSAERALQSNNQLPLDLRLPRSIFVTSYGAEGGSRPNRNGPSTAAAMGPGERGAWLICIYILAWSCGRSDKYDS